MHLNWEVPLHTDDESRPDDFESPVHACGEYLYYACNGETGTDLHIIHADTGEDLVHPLERSIAVLPSTYFAFTHNGQVIFYYGDLLAAQGTQILRKLRVPGTVSQYRVCGNTLVLCCGRLVGIDLDTLTISWFLRLDCDKPYIVGEMTSFGSLLSCYGQDQLLFVDPQNGRIADSIRIPRIDKLYSPIALDEENLLIGYTLWSNAGILRYHRPTQSVTWRHKRKSGGVQLLCRVWHRNGRSYWVKNHTELICVDDETGQELYQLRTAPWLYTDLQFRGDDILYGTAGANGYLNCLDARSGRMRWAVPLRNGCAHYALHGETALAGDFSKRVMQLSLRDGALVDQLQLDGEVMGSIAVHSGHVYTVIWATEGKPARLVSISLSQDA